MDKIETRTLRRVTSLDELPLRQKTGGLNPLNKNAFFQNANYRQNRVAQEKLREVLRALETANPASRRMKESENHFLQSLNAEVDKVNNCCKKAFLQIEDEINFYARKILSLPVIHSELDHVLQDILQLEQYCSTCEKDFLAIMKIHDTIIGANSRAWLENRLEQEYFMNVPYTPSLVRLSKFYAQLRKNAPKATSESTQGVPVRQYFVKDEDFIRAQAWVLRHTTITFESPIVTEQDEEPSELHQHYTSVYLDGAKFPLCNDFLHKVEGACLLRISWEGEDNHLCRISFKTQSGITEGFPIKYRHVDAFLRGTWDFDEHIQGQMKKGKISAENGEKIISTARPIIQLIKQQQLRPIMRLNLSHRAFLSDDKSIRAGLDFSVQFKKVKKGHSWQGKLSKKPKDHTRLPVSLLKIIAPQEPSWAAELVAQKIIHRVPAGHAYDHLLYGVALLTRKAALAQPGWLPFLKALVKEQGDMQKEALPPQRRSARVSTGSSSMERPDNASKDTPSPSGQTHPRQDSSQDDYSDIMEAIKSSFNPKESLSIQDRDDNGSLEGTPLIEAIYFDEDMPPPRPALKQAIKRKVRVEPKTFFSNDRTLFHWVNMAVILSSIAVVLSRLGNSTPIPGLVLLGTAIVLTLYATAIFHFRLSALKLRKATWAFEDDFGPMATMVIIALAVATCIALQYYSTPPMPNYDIQYGMLPGDPPFSPNQIILTAPMPTRPFLFNTTQALTTALQALSQMGVITSKDANPEILTNYTYQSQQLTTGVPSIDEFFRLNVLYDIDSPSCETHPSNCQSIANFDLYSTLPSFQSVPQPTAYPEGTSLFVAQLECGGAPFYRACTAPAPNPINSFQDLDQHIQNASEALGVPSQTQLKPQQSSAFKSWTAAAPKIGARLVIELQYDTYSLHLVSANLKIKFGKNAKITAIDSTRMGLISLLEKWWGPQACQHPIPTNATNL